jgi:vacuolar protein sorting-associated protein 45
VFTNQSHTLQSYNVDVFGGGGNLVAQFRKALVNINGVENVYTQHEPMLSSVFDAFGKHRALKDLSFPNVLGQQANRSSSELIIFMVGGVTFEEATKCAEFNERNPGL